MWGRGSAGHMQARGPVAGGCGSVGTGVVVVWGSGRVWVSVCPRETERQRDREGGRWAQSGVRLCVRTCVRAAGGCQVGPRPSRPLPLPLPLPLCSSGAPAASSPSLASALSGAPSGGDRVAAAWPPGLRGSCRSSPVPFSTNCLDLPSCEMGRSGMDPVARGCGHTLSARRGTWRPACPTHF